MYTLSLPGQPVYTQILRWVQLHMHDYWHTALYCAMGAVWLTSLEIYSTIK
jgi:hypothetical protein